MHQNPDFYSDAMHFFVVYSRHINKQLFFTTTPIFGFISAPKTHVCSINSYATLYILMTLKSQKSI